jgi:hypothetical protein
MMKAGKMKFKKDRPFATPEAAERKLLELANAIAADHAGRLSVAVIDAKFRDAGGSYEEYGLAVKAAVAHGWLTMHPSGAYLRLRAAGYRRSGHDDLPVRLCAFFRAVKAAAEMGLRDLSEVSRAKQRMEERVGGRRRNSRLPELIQLFLYSPVVTVPLAAKSLRVSPQAVEGMIKTLGPGLLRELTGRARNRVWSIR